MSKLNLYKCAHFLLFLSISTIVIRQFHSYTKILTLFPSFSPSIIRISTLIPRIPTLIPCIPISPTVITCIPRIPTLILIIPNLIPCIPIIPLIPFPDSPFRLLQIVINFLQQEAIKVRHTALQEYLFNLYAFFSWPDIWLFLVFL